MDFDLPHSQLTGRVLFVDDEKLVLEMGEQMLTELGCQVTACQKSTEALEIFKNTPEDFDLVLSDISMPIMTGIELATQLHAIKPEITILILSGYFEDADLTEMQKIGVKEILSKPIRIKELALALNRHLPSPE